MLSLDEARSISSLLLDEVQKAIVGKREVLELVLLGMLSDGHVLLEDVPGVAKTLMARSFASVLGADFKRIQFTPDLLPSDITGSFIYDQHRSAFEFREGPVFTDILLADEINRATPKTQSALLEAMQERQVTVEDRTYPLGAPFLVLATQNPIEHEGTYPLPEAQLDRFILRSTVGYPSAADEQEMLTRRMSRKEDEVHLDAVIDAQRFVELQQCLEGVHVHDDISAYIVSIVRQTREHPDVAVGASPRGALAILKLARAAAVLEGRDFVTPEDVKRVAGPALGHRLSLRPELWVRRIRGEDVVASVLSSVSTPSAEH
ncbi:MAG: AAA family ATPase [Actinomycetota bacterium]